ncbi:MAG: hypothetical protein ACLRSW_12265 [Christensenellaceae bacterium]
MQYEIVERGALQEESAEEDGGEAANPRERRKRTVERKIRRTAAGQRAAKGQNER